MPWLESPAILHDGQHADGQHPDGHGQHPDGQHADGYSGGPGERLRQLEVEVAQLREALLSQRQIGVVTGWLAYRFGCTTEQAWDVLVQVSQHTNVKVRVVARVLREAFDGQGKTEDAQLLRELTTRLHELTQSGLSERLGAGSAS